MNVTVTVKISEAIAKEYQLREMRLPVGYPTSTGLHQVGLEIADSMMWDALERAKEETKPSLAMAYNSLATQIKKAIDGAQAESDVSHAKLNNGLVTLEPSQISVGDNVRTAFDQESIEELAEDIKAHGLINPITVRVNNGHYVLVAGERRMRACIMANVPIMAHVIEADNILTRRIQLAENIHREDLGLEDKARAVQELYEQLGSMQAVADTVKKSKAWVSKLVAIAKGLGYWAKKILEEGISEDMEVLGLVEKIDAMSYGTNRCWSIYENLKSGVYHRADLQRVLKEIKDKKKKDLAPRQEKIPPAGNGGQCAGQLMLTGVEAVPSSATQEAAARREYLGLPNAVKNLLRFYVDTQPREHQGEKYQIVTEFSEIPFSGDGEGECYKAFDKDEILKAWRDLVEAFANWNGEIMTEEYFQENA